MRGIVVDILIYFLVSFQFSGIICTNILPSISCTHQNGISLNDWRHLCLGACSPTDIEPGMHRYMIMHSTLRDYRSYGYRITAEKRTLSSHVSFFGSCHISESTVAMDATDISGSDIHDILLHGGAGGVMDHVKDPSCDWIADNHVSGIKLTYQRVSISINEDSGKIEVEFPSYSLMGEGISGRIYSDNTVYAWDLESKLPRCKRRVVGNTFCRVDKGLINCRGEKPHSISHIMDDCGLKVLITPAADYALYDESKAESVEVDKEEKSSVLGKVLDMENIVCHHLCQEAENMMDHDEFLMATPIGNWLSVKAEDHFIFYKCSDISAVLVRPVVVCGSGPMIQLRTSDQMYWWNVSSPYINPDTVCNPAASSSVMRGNVIHTWVGDLIVNDSGISFAHRFKGAAFHPAFRPVKQLFSESHLHIKDIVAGLQYASSIQVKKENTDERRVPMGESIGERASGAVDAAEEWVRSKWPDIKAWAIRVGLWTTAILMFIAVVWGMFRIIIAVVMRPKNVIRVESRESKGSDTSLVAWAKQK
ncbi:ORF5 [Coffee ringspot virus]|uniref:ORF5 n=1 Tax=Coffee ringspot virus TaxID=745716 RepID=W5URR0_9RHAB|nr:ORF5 [Coffee ringspot virus]AHH44829.1 ORF5 [Coffee ringspot virus]